MDFVIDRSGVPAAMFSPNKYIQVLPLTIYQYERFLWQSAPGWNVSGRTDSIPPQDFDRNNISKAFISNLSFEDAYCVCHDLCGGRPPAADEWEVAFGLLFQHENLLERALTYVHSLDNNSLIDTRVVRLLTHMVAVGIRRTELIELYELVSEFPISSGMFGQVCLKSCHQSDAIVTGDPPAKTRNARFGFSVVTESA